MKVAFATEGLIRVDAHFGSAKNIAIYELTPTSWSLLKVIPFDGDLAEDGNEDKLTPKIDAIGDCTLLYVAAIGGSAAARVVAKKIHPIKVAETEEIEVVLGKLKNVLNGTPPPWLRKALLKDEAHNFDFQEE